MEVARKVSGADQLGPSEGRVLDQVSIASPDHQPAVPVPHVLMARLHAEVPPAGEPDGVYPAPMRIAIALVGGLLCWGIVGLLAAAFV